MLLVSFYIITDIMNIQQDDNAQKGKFFIEENGEEAASMHYVYAGDQKFIIDHTVVSPQHEGKGLGKELLKATVAYAREKKMKIIPLCPFAKAMMQKNRAEYADVLA